MNANVIQLDSYRNSTEINLIKEDSTKDYSNRLNRIEQSLIKINKLMQELRALGNDKNDFIMDSNVINLIEHK